MKIVLDWVNDQEFLKLVEEDCGSPVEILIDWKDDLIVFEGPDMKRSQAISEFIDNIRKMGHEYQ